MKTSNLLIVFCLFCLVLNAQENVRSNKQIILSLFNANSLLPGGGDLWITSTVVHPGFDLGLGWSFKQKKNSDWFVNAKAGYFYHRLSQHAIQLFGEIGYRRYFFKNRFHVAGLFGAGYLHAIPDLQVFQINQNGEYDHSTKGSRPQAMIHLNVVPSYTLSWKNKFSFDVFLGYRFMIQTPFAKNYIPLLPYTSFHVGIAVNINSQNN